MKRFSDKRRRENAAAKPFRDAYRAEFPWCQVCETRKGRDVHEIARGPARRAAYQERCCWLHVCPLCHLNLGDYAEFPLSRQLWFKKQVDPANYNLERFLVIYGKRDIEQADVDRWD